MQPRPLHIIIAVLILIAAGIALWFVLSRPSPVGPGGSATSTPSGAEGDVPATLQDNGQYHEITAHYPAQTPLKATAGATADIVASRVMKEFVEQEIARFKDNNVDMLTAEDISIIGLGGERKYVLDIEYKVYESPDTVSYVFSMFADTLGAHPNGYYRTYTFDKESGEGLHLDDIFGTPDYLEVLSMLSRQALAAKLDEFGYDKEYLEAGTTAFADNFQNFYLEGDNFVVLFPPYQVGPWVIGTQTAELPRAELGNTLKEAYR